MKEVIGLILTVVGILIMGLSGLGITVSIVCWVLSLIGLPFIQGAGMLIFKFAGAWLLGAIAAGVGHVITK